MGEKVIIESVNNGYIYSFHCPDRDQRIEHVIQFKDSDHGDLEAFEELLWDLTEILGHPYSKHNKKNINISIKEINKEE